METSYHNDTGFFGTNPVMLLIKQRKIFMKNAKLKGNNMKRNLLLFAILLLLASPAFTQTAAELERLLAADVVSYEQAAWLVLRAADVPVYSSSEAFLYAANQSWLPANAVSNGVAVLDGVSLLLMESFGIKGGLFYSIGRSPHYAYRELVYKGVIQGRADPDMAVSGDLLLFMLGNVLSAGENY